MAAAILHSAKLESTAASGHTVPSFAVPAGPDKRLLVIIEASRAAGNTVTRTVSSVVWNGNNLSSLAQATTTTGTGARLAAFDMALGSTEATDDIVVTLNSTSQGCIIHAFVIGDVEQGTPTPTAVTSNNLSDVITLSAAGIAIDALLNNSNNTASDFSLTAATQTQTSLSPSRTFAGTTNEQNLGTSSVVGTGAQTFGWTATNSANRAHLIVGYLQASTGGAVGDLAATLGALTLASAGQLKVSGTVSANLGALTVEASGSLQGATAGAVSVTLGTVTLAATGAVQIIGALAATLGALTLSAAGGVPSGLVVSTVRTRIAASDRTRTAGGSRILYAGNDRVRSAG